MALTKISDLDLENLRCQCGQYLSKPPIYIQNGQNLCGDCVDLLAPSPLEATRNVACEILAGYATFPCRYKSQGCPLYIKFNEVSNHEALCSFHTYTCPFNEHSSCDWHGTISQLHQHYQSQHPELCPVSSNAKVRVNEDYEEYRVVITDDLPYLLHTKCDTQKDKLWFNIICFTTASNASLLNCTIKLSNKTSTNASLTLEGAKPLPFSSMGRKPRLCVSISNINDVLQSTESVDCSWIINVTEEFRTEFKEQLDREKLAAYEAQKEITRCHGCGIYTVPPIKRCEEDGHVMCMDCIGYYFNKCKICNVSWVCFERATELEEIAKNGLFECKWPNCNTNFSSTEIRQHERICSKRIYTCPECNLWSGQHDQIELHFKSVHEDLSFYVGSEDFAFTGCDVIYFFTCSDFFKLTIDDDDADNSRICYCGSPRFVDNWEFNVMDEQLEKNNIDDQCWYYRFYRNDDYELSIKLKNS